MTDCIFCKIVAGVIPSFKVYEDEKALAFLDINPVNPGHTLVIPKEHYRNIHDTPDELLGDLISIAKKVATKQKEVLGAEGINISMNNESASGQLVFHTHIHIMPRYSSDGFKPWHGTPYKEGEIEKMKEKLKL